MLGLRSPKPYRQALKLFKIYFISNCVSVWGVECYVYVECSACGCCWKEVVDSLKLEIQ